MKKTLALWRESIKINKAKALIFISLFSIIWIFSYSLPWATPVEVIIPKEVKGKVVLSFKHSNGRIAVKEIWYTENQKNRFLSVSLENVTFEKKTYFILINNQGKLSEIRHGGSFVPSTERRSISVLASITVVSFFSSILFSWLITFIIRKNFLKDEWKPLLCFFAHLGINIYVLKSFLPGLYNHDSFDNYYNAANYSYSAFIGFFYSAWLIVLSQVFASEYLVPLLTAILISFTFTFLYKISEKNKVIFAYLLVCIVYYLTPTNFIMSLSVSRDAFSNWFLTLTLLSLYAFLFDNADDIKRKVFLTVLIVVSCLLRQEVVFFLPLFVIGIVYFKCRNLIKWSLATAGLAYFSYFIIGFLPFYNRAMERNLYETTLLINPLSSILKAKYGEVLPSEMDSRLGGFFKNDYLLKYASPQDINPFHVGGVNYDKGEKDYIKFKREALKIFIENPYLFYKNRYEMFSCLFGVKLYCMILFDDSYTTLETPVMKVFKDQLVFRDNFPRDSWLSLILQDFFQFPERYPFALRSYLISFVILVLSVAFSRNSFWYRKILLIVLVRTFLVVLTTPAANYKYNYVLYLFLLLSLPILLSEELRHRNSTSNVIV